MPLYTLVDMTPNDDNLFPVTNIETRNAAPPVINGFRWLLESELAPGATPGIGLYWNGVLPANFSDKPPAPELPTTAQEAWDLIQQRKADLAEAEAALARIMGLE